MIKGLRKNMIFIKKTGSPYFEEAYFVLRSDIDDSEGDIVKEAMRIAGETESVLLRGIRRKKEARRRYMFIGAAACAFSFGVVMMILTFLSNSV